MPDTVTHEDVAQLTCALRDLTQLTWAIKDLAYAIRAMPRPETQCHGGCGSDG